MTNRSTEGGKGPAAKSILALESGGRACSAALWRAGSILVEECVPTDHGHATLLMPMIERVMVSGGCAYADLDRIAVAAGPGSFTGLRVGLAAALGLALASGVPAVGISSFQAVAATIAPALRGRRRLFVLLDSRRDQPFLAELDSELAFVAPPSVVDIKAALSTISCAGDAILAGDAPVLDSLELPKSVTAIRRVPSAASVAGLAADPARRFDLPAKPVYLRAPDVTMPKTSAPTPP